MLNCHFPLAKSFKEFYFPQKTNLFRCNLILRVLLVFLKHLFEDR